MNKPIKMPFNDKSEVALIKGDDDLLLGIAEVKIVNKAELDELKKQANGNQAEVIKKKRIEQLKASSEVDRRLFKLEQQMSYQQKIVSFLIIEHLISGGLVEEPKNYEDFATMVQNFAVKNGVWDEAKIPQQLCSFFNKENEI